MIVELVKGDCGNTFEFTNSMIFTRQVRTSR